jgi:hypothetical protein
MKGLGVVTQVVVGLPIKLQSPGLEFNPQYCKRKKRERKEKET